MTSATQIALVAIAAGVACALAGVFLVLRRMAMMADAISHSILPGLVAGYVLANGPNLLWGFLGATAAGLLTVIVVEGLSKSKKVKHDSAIGIVFSAMFAIGVLIVTKFFANVHIDTDAILFGEIAFAPFDSFILGSQNLGPVSLWILGGLCLTNAAFLAMFYKELKLSTFDAGLAASLGLMPTLIHYLLMAMVALTTVGAFSAVGAILSVALIVVPPVTASLLTRKLSAMIALSVGIGAGSALVGYLLAILFNVSISGMIATTLGIVFILVLLFSPSQGTLARVVRRQRQRIQFATEMLVVHLAAHEDSPRRIEESTLLHLETELNWPPERAAKIIAAAKQKGYITYSDGLVSLTQAGQLAAVKLSER